MNRCFHSSFFSIPPSSVCPCRSLAATLHWLSALLKQIPEVKRKTGHERLTKQRIYKMNATHITGADAVQCVHVRKKTVRLSCHNLNRTTWNIAHSFLHKRQIANRFRLMWMRESPFFHTLPKCYLKTKHHFLGLII